MLTPKMRNKITKALLHPDIKQNFTILRKSLDLPIEAIAMSGSVQPKNDANSGDITNRLDGYISGEVIELYSNTEIIGYNPNYEPDIVRWNDKDYRIVSCQDWGGLWQAEAQFIAFSTESTNPTNPIQQKAIIGIGNKFVLSYVPAAILGDVNIVNESNQTIASTADVTILSGGECQINTSTSYTGKYAIVIFEV